MVNSRSPCLTSAPVPEMLPPIALASGPSTVSGPTPTPLTLTVTESYVEGGVTHVNTTAANFVVQLHDSIKEIGDEGEDFLTLFSQSNIGTNDLFGLRLAITRDGNTLVATSMLQKGGGQGTTADPRDRTGDESGAFYVFTRSGTTWTERAYLKAPNAQPYDEFGSAVAVSGDGTTLAVAAWGEDGGSSGVGGNQADNSVRSSGAVYVY